MIKQEKDKTQDKDQEANELSTHISYTLNHALFCVLSDPVTDPIVSKFTQDLLQKHFPASGSTREPVSPWKLGLAEIAGDLLAVPLVVTAQCLFPHFMQNISKTAEPILGAFFKNGAERSARLWAARHDVALNSEAYQEKVQSIYKREMENVPKLLLWTVSSVAINICTQKLMKNDAPLWHMLVGKAAGAGVTALLSTLARGIAPGATDAIDQFTHQHIVHPVNKLVRNIFGGHSHAKEEHGSWEARVKNESPASLGLA